MSKFKEKIIWPIRYRRAVRSADKRANYIKANIYVLYCGGKLLLMSRRDIVTACAKGIFRARPDQIMRRAIYVAR